MEKLYPCDKSEFQNRLYNLIDTGIGATGRKAKNPKPSYFKNFLILGQLSENGDITDIIESPKSKLAVECKEHIEKDKYFHSSAKNLVDTSKYATKTCIYCEAEYDTRRLYTISSIAKKFKENDDIDFLVDEKKAVEMGYEKHKPLKFEDFVPLICKQSSCKEPTSHSVRNISTVLTTDNKQLCCQGSCDSSPKGKALRKTLKTFEDELTQARGDEWTLTTPNNFIKKTENNWFTHTPCGNKIFRQPSSIINYDPQRLLNINSTDCPFCSYHSAFKCLDNSVKDYSTWVNHVTYKKLSYNFGTFPEDTNHVNVICECGNKYVTTEDVIINDVYKGCKPCLTIGRKKQRAWNLSEAKIVVERRGFTLRGNPLSYTEPAHIISKYGKPTKYKTILELLQSIPAHRNGYGKDKEDRLPINSQNKSKRWTTSEHNELRKMANTCQYVDMAQRIGRTPGAVKQRFRYLGLKNNIREHYGRKYSIKDNAFSQTTSSTCYWAGLLAADATIEDNDQIKLELKVIDETILIEFAKFLNTDTRLTYRTMKNVNGRGVYACLRFVSRQCCEDLKNIFNVVPRKSMILKKPNLTDDVHRDAYMVGLIEGDGHIAIRQGRLIIQFTTASQSNLKWFQEQVYRIIGNQPGSTKLKRKTPTWSTSVHCTYAESLCESLLKSHPGFMVRKWSIAHNEIKTIKNN